MGLFDAEDDYQFVREEIVKRMKVYPKSKECKVKGLDKGEFIPTVVDVDRSSWYLRKVALQVDRVGGLMALYERVTG